jgi:hypothetical protein
MGPKLWILKKYSRIRALSPNRKRRYIRFEIVLLLFKPIEFRSVPSKLRVMQRKSRKRLNPKLRNWSIVRHLVFPQLICNFVSWWSKSMDWTMRFVWFFSGRILRLLF